MMNTNKKERKLAIIGLGYVGLPLAVEFGKQRNVFGYDISENRIEELKSKFDRTMECSAEDLSNASKLSFTSDERDLQKCDFFIVTVPTPVDHANRPNLSNLISASELVGRFLKKNDIVVYESTVFPGATEEVCVPVLEKFSGLVFNRDFFCGYSPERINPGDKINTLTQITKIVSGSSTNALLVIDSVYKEIISAGTWITSSIKVAEASKVIENTQRDLNIAFVNELSVIFERLNIDTSEVLEAAGTKWNFLQFKPGIVGGHCIGVDPYYLTHKAEQIGYNPQIILAGRRLNDNMARYAARNMIKRMLKRGINVAQSIVGIFGVTFKENCPDTRNSKVFDMIKEFEAWGITVMAFDPWADAEEVKQEHGVHLVEKVNMKELDALVVAVSHSEFREMDVKELVKFCKDPSQAVLGDIKAIYDRAECKFAGFEVFRF